MDSNNSEDLIIIRNSQSNDPALIQEMQKWFCKMRKDGIIVLPKDVDVIAFPSGVQVSNTYITW